MQDGELREADSRAFGQRVREELARRRVSRQALADMAKISLSTLEKALSGTRPFTLASKIRIEEALGLGSPRPSEAAQPNFAAPERLGAYVRAAVRWLEGSYLTIRPSFGTADALFAYLTEVRWDDERGHLVFAERKRLDSQFEQQGEVSLPNLSGHIYLITNDSGQHRLVVLGRPTISGALYGLLTTLEVGQGSQLVPASCPIALVPITGLEHVETGVIAPDSSTYDSYRAQLSEATAKDFARLHL